jgi:hypothetical protein
MVRCRRDERERKLWLGAAVMVWESSTVGHNTRSAGEREIRLGMGELVLRPGCGAREIKL